MGNLLLFRGSAVHIFLGNNFWSKKACSLQSKQLNMIIFPFYMPFYLIIANQIILNEQRDLWSVL